MADEEWSWKRWITGFISGKRYGKDFAILIRLALLISLIFLVSLGFGKVKALLFPKESSPTKHTDKSKIDGNSGSISQVDSHSTSSVVHNHSPLENGILGAIFGSKDQVIKEGDK